MVAHDVTCRGSDRLQACVDLRTRDLRDVAALAADQVALLVCIAKRVHGLAAFEQRSSQDSGVC